MINLNEICDCCGGAEPQAILQLFNDRCFRVVEGKETRGEFCIGDFAFPVDGYNCIGLEVDADGGIFDNQVEVLSPNDDLEIGRLYARGVMIRIIYPAKDTNGDDLAFTDKSVRLYMQNAETFDAATYPIYDLFTIFTNPKSSKAKDLINKIKVINPNPLYKIKISALVLYGKAT